MYGFQTFKWLRGPYDHHGMLEFPANLALNTADNDQGVVKAGKPMGYLSSDITKMAYAGTLNFLGLLMHEVNAYGTRDDAGFKKFVTGQTQLPLARGQNITLRQPLPGSEAEFETDANSVSAIENLLVFKVGETGTFASNTAYNTEVGLTAQGCFCVAQEDTLIIAKLLKADLPKQKFSSGLRIRLQFVSPHRKNDA